jgi:GNAT superfamily N-acetyltransferase
MGAVRRSGRERAPDPARACQPAQNGSDGADEPAEDILAHSCGSPSTAKASGLLVLVPSPDGLVLESVAVRPAAQGSGVGGRLLALAGDRARGLGLTEIRLYTNVAMTENLAYLPAARLHRDHRGEDDGFSRVYFTKQLPGG